MEKKMWWLRFAEKFIVAVILMLVSGGIWWIIFNPTSSIGSLTWGLILLVLLLIILLVIQNIVDRYFKEAILIANQSDDEKFRSLYERSPTPHITVNPDGRIVMFNPAAVRLLKSTTDTLLSLNFFDFIVEHSGHDESFLPSKIRGSINLVDEEVSLRNIAGEQVWTLMSVYEDAQSGHHIISLIDITQAKKIDSAKTEFVALATHQLRTPIAAIRWNFELLSKKLPGEIRDGLDRYLDKVGRNVTRMIKLIDDFLSVSQLETGTFAASAELFSLGDYFSSILDEYDEKLTDKNIKVTRHETPEDFQFKADSRLFHIIVSNLVSNAVKYMKSEGNLTLAYEATGNELIIRVADDGIGIPDSEQEQLFKRFFRASNARLHQTEGTGLGLYIVKQAVEQLGGTIEVQSTENVQTIFTVTLPIR